MQANDLMFNGSFTGFKMSSMELANSKNAIASKLGRAAMEMTRDNTKETFNKELEKLLTKTSDLPKDEKKGSSMSVDDIIDLMRNNHKLTADNINEKDWRYMSEKDWARMIGDVDNYLEDVRRQIEQMKKLQLEAARKAAANAPADRRTAAASSAVLQVAANGFCGTIKTEDSAKWIEENSWTYELETDDQEILAKAKAANDMAKDIMSKAEEIMLKNDDVLISEYVDVENKDKNKEKESA